MKKREFAYTTPDGTTWQGTVESEVNCGYNLIDYARVELEAERDDCTLRLKFSRDLVEHLGGQGQKSVSEDLYVERYINGVGIDRDLIDVSGGRPHVVDLDAAGEWGKIVREALASIGR
jgi:hypothetical protein